MQLVSGGETVTPTHGRCAQRAGRLAGLMGEGPGDTVLSAEGGETGPEASAFLRHLFPHNERILENLAGHVLPR